MAQSHVTLTVRRIITASTALSTSPRRPGCAKGSPAAAAPSTSLSRNQLATSIPLSNTAIAPMHSTITRRAAGSIRRKAERAAAEMLLAFMTLARPGFPWV